MKSDKMKDYLPDYYRESPQMDAIMEAEGAKLEVLASDTKDVKDQLTIQTATWEILRYEEIYAVVPEANDTIEARRNRLLSRLRLRSPTTKKEFIRFLAPFADHVDIVEHFSEYLVEFIFTGKKTSFRAIDKALRPAMPAHLNWNLRIEGSFQFGSELYYAGGFQFSSLPRESEFVEGYGFSSLDNPSLGGAFRYPSTEFDSRKGFSDINESTGGFFGGLYIKESD